MFTVKNGKNIQCPAVENGIFVRADGVSGLCCALSLTRDESNRLRIKKEQQDLSPFFENNDLKHRILSQLKSGSFPKECMACEKRENQNYRSYRQRTLEKWGNENQDLCFINLEFGNICNFRCVYCSPTFSHSWNAEADIQREFNIFEEDIVKSDWIKNNFLWKYLIEKIKDSPSFRTLEIVGGEPFLNPEHDQFLQELIKNGVAKKIDLLYSSNFSQISSEQISYLKEFRDCELNFSIDSLNPEKFHYIRFPGRLSQVLENFHRVKKEDLLVRPFLTIHALNVSEIPELIEWSLDHGVPPAFNVIQYPRFFHPASLSLLEREDISEKINKFKFSRKDQLISELKKPYSEDLNVELKNYLSRLDARRGLEFGQVFKNL